MRVCICVCVCVCVRESVRERARVCVCVCVCAAKRAWGELCYGTKPTNDKIIFVICKISKNTELLNFPYMYSSWS